MKILSNSPGVLWDCHMHSEFSADSGTPTEDMIRQAIALGLKGICFTEHLDPDYPPTPDDLEFALDIPAYYTKFNELKETYKNQIHIHFGIEIGLQLHLKQYFHNLLIMILITATVIGLFNSIFTRNKILGASGITFMLIVLSSFVNFSTNKIPLTFILIVLFYVIDEIRLLGAKDSVSHGSHFLGALCGFIFSYIIFPS